MIRLDLIHVLLRLFVRFWEGYCVCYFRVTILKSEYVCNNNQKNQGGIHLMVYHQNGQTAWAVVFLITNNKLMIL